MKAPFFSVVIPTRNRAETLEYSIQTILNQTFSDFEIIVSDNSVNEASLNIVKKFEDKRLFYHKTKGNLSMVDNWEYALQFVNGKYVLYLGDDDGLLSRALEIANECISNTKTEVLMFDWVDYNWPNQTSPAIVSNQITMKRITSEAKFIDSKTTLENVLEGRSYYHVLPTIYSSFISVGLIKSVMTSGNRFFNSLNPDVYSGVLICYFASKIYKTNSFLGIRGTSSKANGAVFLFRDETNKDLQDDFINLNNLSSVKWNEQMPFIVISYVFGVESYLQFCKVFNLKIPKTKIVRYYLKIIRRTREDNILNSKKARTDFKAIREVIKLNPYISNLSKLLLINYINKLEKKLIDQPQAMETIVNAIPKAEEERLVIDAEKLNVKNVFDAQKIIDELLSLEDISKMKPL